GRPRDARRTAGRRAARWSRRRAPGARRPRRRARRALGTGPAARRGRRRPGPGRPRRVRRGAAGPARHAAAAARPRPGTARGLPARRRRARGRRRGPLRHTGARPAPRPGAAAVDVGLHRLAQAGAAVLAQPGGQRRGRRRLPADPAHRPRRAHPAAALLLRPVGGAQQPAPRRVRAARPGLGHRPRVLAGVPRARRHQPARRAAHVRPAGAGRLRRARPAAPALRDAGRGPLGPRRGAALGRAGAAARLGPLRHVRPDGGHRADGVPAAGPGGH
ncbi:MAG: Polyketide synthase modules and related proteins, partial [uncultured Pseudonocardia sp.]